MVTGMRRTLFSAALTGTALVMMAAPSLAARYTTPSFVLGDIGKTAASVRVTAGPDGAVGGFRIQWMEKSAFDALGGWPAVEDYNIGLVYCQFYGDPTLNLHDGTTTFQLGPNAGATIEVGDVFDEGPGMYANYDGELHPGVQYIIRGRAEGYGPILASFWSADQIFPTESQLGSDCTYTQGYWKNHPEDWPTNSLIIGTVSYTQAELLAILNTPAQGNGLISLAHQVIAMMLNIANGATVPVLQQTTLNLALNPMIGSLVIPPILGSTAFLAPSSTAAYTQTLDEYNNGFTGPGHCQALPVEHSTWSRIKTLQH